MALCFVPSHAVRRRCNMMSIKYWLSSLSTHCHPNFSSHHVFQVIHYVFIVSVIVSMHVWQGGGEWGGGSLLLIIIIISCRDNSATANQEQQHGDDSRVKEEGEERERWSQEEEIMAFCKIWQCKQRNVAMLLALSRTLCSSCICMNDALGAKNNNSGDRFANWNKVKLTSWPFPSSMSA